MTANPGKGTILQLSIASTLTTIAQRVEITGPGFQMGTRDTTDLDSTAKTHSPTLLDAGKLTLKINYDPTSTTHEALIGLMVAQPPAVASWKLIFADAAATPIPFTGTLTGFNPGGMTVEGTLTADLEITLSGLPTVP